MFRLTLLAIAVAAAAAMPRQATAQTPGDSLRARLKDSDAWVSGRFVWLDTALVMNQAGHRITMPRAEVLRAQTYSKPNPALTILLGLGIAVGGYTAARLIAGSGSTWACSGCGLTWSEDRDYFVFGASGLALGLVGYAAAPRRWKTVLGPY